MTQSAGTPSAGVSSTSLGMSRIVRVIGATVASPRYSSAESRVRITTGRRLSGRPNVYHRTSPRRTNHPTADRMRERRTLLEPSGVWRIRHDVWLRVAAREASASTAGGNPESGPSGSCRVPSPYDPLHSVILPRASSVSSSRTRPPIAIAIHIVVHIWRLR